MAAVIRSMYQLRFGIGSLSTLEGLGLGLVITSKGQLIWVEGMLAIILLMAWVSAIKTKVPIHMVLAFF